jgi:hypothetical protein
VQKGTWVNIYSTGQHDNSLYLSRNFRIIFIFCFILQGNFQVMANTHMLVL